MKNMRAWLSTSLLTLLAVAALTVPAHAAWKVEDVKWRMQGRQAIGISGPFTDTSLVSAAPARADTTASWTMLDCEIPSASDLGLTSATLDSMAIAYLHLVADSTVASTVNFKATTVTFQINYGRNASGWQTWGSALSVLPTDGDKVMMVPIYRSTTPITITADFGATAFGILPTSILAPQVRAIVTWGASAAAPSTRVIVRKFAGHAQYQYDGRTDLERDQR